MADVIVKDLELRSTWVIWVGPEFSDRCPYETHTEEKRHTEDKTMR